MPFPNPDTQFSSTNQPANSGRPKGRKNWSTVVRELMEDPEFSVKVMKRGKETVVKYPAKVITEVMIGKALSGDVQAANFLRKTGYGDKLTIEQADEEEKAKEDRYAGFLDGGHDDLQDDGETTEATGTGDTPSGT